MRPRRAATGSSRAAAAPHAPTTATATGTGTDLCVLDTLLGFHLRRAQLINFRAFPASVCGVDVTPTRFAALALVGANPGLSQTDLGRTLGMDRATAMAVVDRLCASGWVSKRRSTVDRRKHALRTTARGRTALRHLKDAVVAHEQQYATGLSARESARMFRLVRKLCATTATSTEDDR